MWIPVSPVLTLTLHLLVPADTPPTSPAPTPPAAAAPAAPAATASSDARRDAIVDAIQKTYDGTTDFAGTFTQRYTYTLLRRTEESKGEVKFKKPGLMRWDYQQPKKKSFVVDGTSLWLHSHEDNTAFVNACFKNDGLTASVAFLWGQGKIREQFDVAWFEGIFGDKSDHHLALTPKQGNSIFAKLIIVVDPKSSRVKQSIVVDPSGNVNQFIYGDLRFNKALPDNAFAFAPPKGAHVARLPGSCDAPVKGLP
ncbi:MAG: outer membrane lipoprotein carrier protein LolA [Deltaproteobacteria bacterium]|nr:outer membrane lipoprotein carrier protein LolA [Deltaproteobacteria bacterium]